MCHPLFDLVIIKIELPKVLWLFVSDFCYNIVVSFQKIYEFWF